jgi:uncharacterized protein YneF (UPF0154 family)
MRAIRPETRKTPPIAPHAISMLYAETGNYQSMTNMQLNINKDTLYWTICTMEGETGATQQA